MYGLLQAALPAGMAGCVLEESCGLGRVCSGRVMKGGTEAFEWDWRAFVRTQDGRFVNASCKGASPPVNDCTLLASTVWCHSLLAFTVF